MYMCGILKYHHVMYYTERKREIEMERKLDNDRDTELEHGKNHISLVTATTT